MPGDTQTGLRITLWPGAPLAVPPVWGTEGKHHLIFGDLVFRELLDLDVNDPKAIATFTKEYGGIQEGAADRLGFLSTPSIPWSASAYRGRVEEDVFLMEPGTPSNDEIHLRAARAMVLHWIARQEETSPPEVYRVWISEGIEPPAKSLRRMDALFTQVLSAGLRAVHVRATVEGDPITVDLFSALCIQLYNVIAEGTPVARCANEPCRRPFVYQRGRSRLGGHRIDSIYCSRECARAQVQREYRRRMKKGRTAKARRK